MWEGKGDGGETHHHQTMRTITLVVPMPSFTQIKCWFIKKVKHRGKPPSWKEYLWFSECEVSQISTDNP